MAKNKAKEEYANSGGGTGFMSNPVFRTWLFEDTKRVFLTSESQIERLTERYGKPHFFWVDGDRRKLSAWKVTEGDYTVYIFSHKGRGTSCEIKCDDIWGEPAGKFMVAFADEVFIKGQTCPSLGI